jgi:molybdate transport system ATP-binding protein
MMGKVVPFITIKDVSLRLGGQQESMPIRWQILSDQTWLVTGPNASGKSSLMRAISGQIPVAGGEIVYHLEDDAQGRLPQDQIAYLDFDAQRAVLGRENPFHQARWNNWRIQDTLSVSEYLSEESVRGINPFQIVDDRPDPALFAARRVEVIELLGIEPLLDRDIIQVSNGERRKVLLARALLKDPRLLILDNPFTGLDHEFKARLEEIIATLVAEGLRIILVANAGEPVPRVVTHVLSMADYEVMSQGPKESVSSASRQPPKNERPSVTCGQPLTQGQAPRGRKAEGRVLVQMRNVGVAYNGSSILAGIDWTVRQGEKWALLGPNGAGKTTLLSLILGDNPQAYANEVTLFGNRRGSGESIWDIKRQIGWIAPELHLYHPKSFTCLDIVCSGFFDSIGLYQRPSAQQRKDALAWMERLDVSHHSGTNFRQVSEGEQRLVLIARALVKGPALLVLDEPCQGLDGANRNRVVGMVEALGNDTTASMIYVTHQLDALPNTITHTLELDKGRTTNLQET